MLLNIWPDQSDCTVAFTAAHDPVMFFSQPSKASVCQLAHRAGGDGPVPGPVLREPKQVQSPVEAQLQKGLQRRGQ